MPTMCLAAFLLQQSCRLANHSNRCAIKQWAVNFYLQSHTEVALTLKGNLFVDVTLYVMLKEPPLGRWLVQQKACKSLSERQQTLLLQQYGLFYVLSLLSEYLPLDYEADLYTCAISSLIYCTSVSVGSAKSWTLVCSVTHRYPYRPCAHMEYIGDKVNVFMC